MPCRCPNRARPRRRRRGTPPCPPPPCPPPHRPPPAPPRARPPPSPATLPIAIVSLSGLHGACGKPADEAPLHREKQDERRDHGESGGGHHRPPLRVLAADEV